MSLKGDLEVSVGGLERFWKAGENVLVVVLRESVEKSKRF